MSHTLTDPQAYAPAALDLRNPARQALRSLHDIYALGAGQIWVGTAVLLGLVVAGWCATLLGAPLTPPAQDWIRL